MNPAPAFLKEFTRDIVAISGLFGVLLTILGLGVAYRQLRKTAGANAAAIDALNESRKRYEMYLVGQIHRLHAEARQFVSTQQWMIAALRLDDVADLTAHFSDEEWTLLSDRLFEISTQFQRIQAAEIRWQSVRLKWRKLNADLIRKISQHHAPFRPTEEIDNADKKNLP